MRRIALVLALCASAAAAGCALFAPADPCAADADCRPPLTCAGDGFCARDEVPDDDDGGPRPADAGDDDGGMPADGGGTDDAGGDVDIDAGARVDGGPGVDGGMADDAGATPGGDAGDPIDGGDDDAGAVPVDAGGPPVVLQPATTAVRWNTSSEIALALEDGTTPDGWVVTAPATHGVVELDAASVKYVPAPDDVGADAFRIAPVRAGLQGADVGVDVVVEGAASCRMLFDTSIVEPPDGVYEIDPDGARGSTAPFPAHCDMAANGFTFVLRSVGTSTAFEYASTYWTTEALLNEAGGGAGTDEAKLASFSRMAADQLRIVMTVGATRTTRNANFQTPVRSLWSAFATEQNAALDVGRPGWLALVPGASLQLSCDARGVNAFGTNPLRAAVRVGIVANQEADCTSPNSYIGIGGRALVGDACLVGVPATAITGNVQCSDGATAVDIPAIGELYLRSDDFTAVAPALSCDALFARGLPAGRRYAIDPDGPGGADPVATLCAAPVP